MESWVRGGSPLDLRALIPVCRLASLFSNMCEEHVYIDLLRSSCHTLEMVVANFRGSLMVNRNFALVFLPSPALARLRSRQQQFTRRSLKQTGPHELVCSQP